MAKNSSNLHSQHDYMITNGVYVVKYLTAFFLRKKHRTPDKKWGWEHRAFPNPVYLQQGKMIEKEGGKCSVLEADVHTLSANGYSVNSP